MLTKNGDILPEIKRRVMLGWVPSGNVDNIMRSTKATMRIERKIFNELIMPVMTYGSEMSALNKTTMHTLAVAQCRWSELC